MKIKVKNLSFAHDIDKNDGAKTKADKTINNFNIEFTEGKFYSLLGPNGSGKTTFLDLLTGFLKPATGSIFLDNQNILSFSRKELAKKIALVSQDYYINFPYTVKEVVTMGRHPYMGRFSSLDKEDINIVNDVAATTEINNLMARKITRLSGGERQRCIFARALCQKTPVLLLDEAFSNMDINHSFNLLKNIKKQIKETNITIISVFHDINFASIWSDKMIFLKKGEIIASGSPEKVMTEKFIKRVYSIDAKIEHNKFANAKQVYFSTN
ncbi:MAG: ABC transporter ATP-binding protein [Desulfobacteraceae bacterium]|nr:ABC transporter ATP-binding protein [Desulfobacteraceae bacterium]